MKLTEQQLDDITHHLQVAASRYDENAETVCVPEVANTFREQAKEARELAHLIAQRDAEEVA